MDSELKYNRYYAVRQHLRTFPDWTTTQGIPQFGLAKRRICCGFWFVCTLIATGLLLWQVILSITEYYQRGVNVNIELQFEQRVFPAVTVCDSNPYKNSMLDQYPKVKQVLDTYKYAARKLVCAKNAECNYDANSTLDQFEEEYRFTGINNTGELRQLAKTLTYLAASEYDMSPAMVSKSDLVLACSFNTIGCSDSDWTYLLDPYVGNCYQFNMNSEHQAQRAGPVYGLRLQLKTNVSEYVAVNNGASVIVMVHDQDEHVIPGSVGYNVETGTRTEISVTYTQISRLGSPYGDCSDAIPDGYLYDGNYNTELCQRSEYQKMMIESCDCYDPRYPTPNDTKVDKCNIDDNLSCWLDYNNQTVGEDCYQPCNDGVYAVTISSATWPTSVGTVVAGCYENAYPEGCQKAFGENAAWVEIYYEKLNYETMEESPAATVSSVLSDIGGQIGLFLGMSVISFVDFVILFLQLLLSCILPRYAYLVDFD
ncbi:unnamed protein product [Bursaphelenchus xylophilus]|uniref:(pine wood nematode) hypothetical protein n=1 Tax=Bursaphelenchus xylophilus TaxID=6326 RepID=A0A1I7S9P5_BURXY|nr:unnamed protein product [Bursaphelenchus xylophilus]CAG9131908.1 unnamed protein product [Bursaphelenchus xylophilus]